MRPRTRPYLIATLVAAVLPTWASSQPPDDEASRPPESPPAQVEPGRSDPRGTPATDDDADDRRAQGTDGTDRRPREGAGSMEPDPRSQGGDEVREDEAEKQHREGVESIWNSP